MDQEVKTPKADPTTLPELAYSDLPEVLNHDLPEALKDDLPEAVPSHDDGLEVAVSRSKIRPSWRRRHAIWRLLVTLVILGAILGGAIGGTKAAKSRRIKTNSTSNSIGDSIQKGYVYPNILSSGPGRLDVVGVNDQGLFWHKALINESWQQWDVLSRNTTPDSNVAAIPRGVDLLNFFLVGKGNSVWGEWWRGSPPNMTMEPKFGTHSSSIEVASGTSNRVDLFSLNQAGKLQQNTMSESGSWDANWRLVAENGGQSAYLFTPTTLTTSGGSGDIFVVDAKSLEVFQTTWLQNGTYSVQFRSLGGACTSRPTAASWAQRTVLFCRGKDAKLWSIFSSESVWTEWTAVVNSPVIKGEPHAVTLIDDLGLNRLFVFVQTDTSYALGRYVANQSSSISGTPEWRDMAGTFVGPPRAAVANYSSPRVYVAGYNGFRNLVVRHIDIKNGEFFPSVWQDIGHAT